MHLTSQNQTIDWFPERVVVFFCMTLHDVSQVLTSSTGFIPVVIHYITKLFNYRKSNPNGARCSSAVRAFAHGAMGCRIDPLWGGPIELFLVPASAP